MVSVVREWVDNPLVQSAARQPSSINASTYQGLPPSNGVQQQSAATAPPNSDLTRPVSDISGPGYAVDD